MHGARPGGTLKSTVQAGLPDKLNSTILVRCFAIVPSMRATNLAGSQKSLSIYRSQGTVRFPIKRSNQFGESRSASVIGREQPLGPKVISKTTSHFNYLATIRYINANT